MAQHGWHDAQTRSSSAGHPPHARGVQQTRHLGTVPHLDKVSYAVAQKGQVQIGSVIHPRKLVLTTKVLKLLTLKLQQRSYENEAACSAAPAKGVSAT